MSKESTIANEALASIDASATKSTSKKSTYKAGLYRSDKFLRVIKSLSYEHRKDANGTVQKTYGTWAKDDNMIIFQKGVPRELTESDLQLPTIRRLIDSKAIFKVGD